MVTAQEIIELLNHRLKKILLVAQSALTEHQYEAYRKIVLDEFGKSGFCKDLERLLNEKYPKDRTGQGWNR